MCLHGLLFWRWSEEWPQPIECCSPNKSVRDKVMVSPLSESDVRSIQHCPSLILKLLAYT
jgi:hypothetical protein